MYEREQIEYLRYAIVSIALFYFPLVYNVLFEKGFEVERTASFEENINAEEALARDIRPLISSIPLDIIEHIPSVSVKSALDIYIHANSLCRYHSDQKKKSNLQEIKGIGAKKEEAILKFVTLPFCTE